MLVIPVIDLQHGQLVQARQGLRDAYQPLQSILGRIASLQEAISAYRQLYPFTTFYIADLDAITGVGDHFSIVETAANCYANYQFWLDAGIASLAQTAPIYQTDNVTPIIGTEQAFTLTEYQQLIARYPDALLSLDINETGPIQNNELFQRSDLWPNRVILMLLHRVGSNQGIDTKLMQRLPDLQQGQTWFLAGGIRNKDDIIECGRMGIDAVLLASSLHNGQVRSTDIKHVQK